MAAAAVYRTIAPTRGKAVPAAFLKETRPEVWLSDRLAAEGNRAKAYQYCLAHLIRDAQYAIDAACSHPPSKERSGPCPPRPHRL